MVHRLTLTSLQVLFDVNNVGPKSTVEQPIFQQGPD